YDLAEWGTPAGYLPASELFSLRNRNVPHGTPISNLTPVPGFPVSLMVIPVRLRISREKNSPKPLRFPEPRRKIFYLSSVLMPIPLSW
ncbi:MAG: hypothetical protein MUP10_01195, partial [Methanoregulaceae archaeon]|nr:hypothetical protein [Methanoregulaceae archaeon]